MAAGKRTVGKPTKRMWATLCCLVLACYAFSYLAFSLKGAYASTIFGLGTGPHGTAVMAPKAMGYMWYPNFPGDAVEQITKWH